MPAGNVMSEARHKGPVGQGSYVVRRGECISSIAEQHGFAPASIWELPENAELRAARRDMNILLEGDRVAIPERRLGVHEGQTERLHRFRRVGVPEVLRICLKDEDEHPRRRVRYELEIDGKRRGGVTDAEGWIRAWIPPAAVRGTLRVLDDRVEVFELLFGHLDPEETEEGIGQRLTSLGYIVDGDDLADPAVLRGATLAFQLFHGLDATGELDDATRAAITRGHGS